MKNFKILSIDGGGIKGLYSARILSRVEKYIQEQNSDPNLTISDFFDLICGTSTGGLIALAISLKKPMDLICQFYEIHGRKIFKNPNSYWRKYVRQIIYNGKYSDKYLKEVLIGFFGESKIGESQNLLCIPSFDFTHSTYAIFKYDHKEGRLNRHNKLSYVDIALSTSAAPTYFPLTQIEEENNTQYLDGGVWANNPSMVGITEAIWHFVGDNKEYDGIQLLSVASLNIKKGNPPMAKRKRAFIDWQDDLFELSLIGQSEFSDVFLKALARETKIPLKYFRIPSATISPKQVDYISLDNASEKSLALMKQLGDDMYYKIINKNDFGDLFKNRKTYSV